MIILYISWNECVIHIWMPQCVFRLAKTQICADASKLMKYLHKKNEISEIPRKCAQKKMLLQIFRKKKSSTSVECMLTRIFKRKHTQNRSIPYATAVIENVPSGGKSTTELCIWAKVREGRKGKAKAKARKTKHTYTHWKQSRNKISLNSHLHKMMRISQSTLNCYMENDLKI